MAMAQLPLSQRGLGSFFLQGFLINNESLKIIFLTGWILFCYNLRIPQSPKVKDESMSEKEFPEESEKTIYQRDKIAKEPVAPSDAPKPVIKPKVKKKKVFVAKKVSYTTDKQMESRVRHIRISSMDTAGVIRDTLTTFQEELAAQPTDDPDKEFHDREKLEAFFSRLARKYSICGTKKLGGDIGWVYKGMKIWDEIMTEDLLEILLKTEKYFIPEPIKTRLGIHLVLICESQIHVPKEVDEPENKPILPPAGTNIPT